MALTKPPVLPVWADTGDKTQPTDAEIQTGWPVSNIPPARQRFNWFFNFCANAVRYLTRRGIPDWAADETYLIGDRVQGPDGKTYVSLANANINFTPASNPGVWDTWGYTSTQLAPIISSGLMLAGIQYKSVSFPVEATKFYLVDTSVNAVIATLPVAPATGDAITFQDASGTWGVNVLTIGRNGKNIMGLAEDLTVAVSDLQFTVWYNGTEWRLV